MWLPLPDNCQRWLRQDCLYLNHSPSFAPKRPTKHLHASFSIWSITSSVVVILATRLPNTRTISGVSIFPWYAPEKVQGRSIRCSSGWQTAWNHNGNFEAKYLERSSTLLLLSLGWSLLSR